MNPMTQRDPKETNLFVDALNEILKFVDAPEQNFWNLRMCPPSKSTILLSVWNFATEWVLTLFIDGP